MKIRNDNSDLHRYIHSFCFENKDILFDSVCNVCIYCKQKVNYADIDEWIIENSGKESAICPHCGIDCVVPKKIEGLYELNSSMIYEMHNQYF